jgi:hypothetical protein
MKENIAQIWTVALRSGKYEQGRLFLQTSHEGVSRFCCLGVLCELYQEYCRENGKKELSTKISDIQPCIYYGQLSSSLPTVVQNWAGINSGLGDLSPHYSLSTSNDNGASFDTIANLIEKNWEIL